MSRLWKRVRLVDKVKWNQGTAQLALSTFELMALNEVMMAIANKRNYIVTVVQTINAGKIADKAIANMISSADFHP